MGCDIHVHVEIKVNGEWLHYNHPRIPRNYPLFAMMAGVRNYDEVRSIAEPRGIPEDATKTTRFDFDYANGDAHTASWLGTDEIGQLSEWFKEQGFPRRGGGSGAWFDADYFGFLFGNGMGSLREYPDDYPKGLEEVRFVFWFDN